MCMVGYVDDSTRGTILVLIECIFDIFILICYFIFYIYYIYIYIEGPCSGWTPRSKSHPYTPYPKQA